MGLSLQATIVVPTKNRKDYLRIALISCLQQSVPVEIIVMDDGSTDGTEQMVRKEFPTVLYYCLATGKGPCFQRNRGIELASCPIVFPIDDDSEMVSPRTVEESLADFDHPRVGAVAIPFRNMRCSMNVHQQCPGPDRIYLVSEFVGASHAVRKDVFCGCGGYHEPFFYMGEESDLCVRMLEQGYVVRLGRSLPIHHHVSPERSHKRVFFFNARNNILFGWRNVPRSHLLTRWAGMTLHLLQYGLSKRHPIWTLQGILHGYWDALLHPGWRNPVGRGTYRLNRLLRSRNVTALDAIEHRLPLCRIDARAMDCK